MLNAIIKFFLDNKLVTWLLLVLLVGWGLVTAPFDFELDMLPRDPVSVDAIPDIGENQQIVYTQWTGRSPQDVEDQITYPLTSALLGIPGVKSVRSNSMFGFSSIYLIFDEDVEFYWSRSRILEKLNSLPANLLPEEVVPTLGPDATALGQIFWYTLEGRNEQGQATGGWNPDELRSIQDFYVKFGLLSAEGVSEVASIGGYVREYRVDIDPEKLKGHGLSLMYLMRAVKGSNLDVGAQTIEINQAEYFVRGLGYVKSISDIEESVITTRQGIPITIKDVAHVYLGPSTRRGILDKSGAHAVGGVIVARYGANPLSVIENVKAKIDLLQPGLPEKILADGSRSKVHIVPFYDRTQLINETIGTLEEALTLEILITVIVVILLLFHLKSSLLVAGTLPVAVLMCFNAMKYFGVDANIVALSGIAIAIGTMVDMGIVLTESILDRKRKVGHLESLYTTVYEATREVSSAVLTAVATTVISFLPVFAMEAAEGKLFRPLAYTKTFALIAAVIVAICFIPPLAHTIFGWKIDKKKWSLMFNIGILAGSLLGYFYLGHVVILIATLVSVLALAQAFIDHYFKRGSQWCFILINLIYALLIAIVLTREWMPLGVEQSTFKNVLFVVTVIAILLILFTLMIRYYSQILHALLKAKILFLLVVGVMVWYGYSVFKSTGQEFMPSLNEGSFLLMPTAMPHSGIQENEKNLRLLDMAVTAIPEVETVVGKAGRVSSALDPAPMSMYENIINYKSEYKTDTNGKKLRYKYENGEYVYDNDGQLIPDKNGRYYRQWRDEIRSPDDIWNEIVKVTKHIYLILTLLAIVPSANGQTIDQLIGMAQTHNPGLKAMQLEYQVALEKAEQVSDYPNPSVSLGIGALPIETRLGAQVLKMGITQPIPWKGLLKGRSELLSAQAEILAQQDELREIDISYAIRSTYAQLIWLERRKAIITKKLELLETMEDLSTATVRSGKGMLSNVLIVQRMKELLQANLEQLENRKKAPSILINRWTGQPLDQEIQLIDELSTPDSLQQYIGYAQQSHPRLLTIEKQIQASKKRSDLTELEKKPQISVGLDYAMIRGRSDVDIPHNGRDVLMPMGMIKIPIHTDRYASIKNEETLRRQMLQEQIKDVTEQYEAEILQAQAEIDYERDEISKYEQLKSITRETIDLMRSEYTSDGTRFEELLRLQLELIDYDDAILASRYRQELATARILKYQ